MRMPFWFIPLLFVSVSAHAQQIERFICREESGGWCESSSGCQMNHLPPAEFRLLGVIPDELGTQAATFTECRGDCGVEWEAQFVRGLGNQLRILRNGEELVLDLETGFFSYALIASAQSAGRVTYAFGQCERLSAF
ncbi:hypothetical protein OZN62_01060 [Aurantiacibacter sp. MUD11]|uniref:hypothetical protein n=1 Tax=Aurantiacibacter sp. MUD11 TaxID=3003265 RepID=UPI0022AA938D|nr:hypothetical protein [Aurantiacibacter sp. MUD11]WAT18198.1 hypothetical protein OZN62_01060 [Aurantiacibacter sp. MUD11]